VRWKGDTIEAEDLVYRLVLTALLVAPWGCENPGIDEGAATLHLLETHPKDGATGTQITGPVRMEFNESIDRRSVESAFRLVDEGGHEVFGTLTVEGNKVRFDPELPLSLSERYKAVVTTAISGRNGASLEKLEEWSFSTAKGKLGPAQKIGTIESHDDAFQMSVTIDEQARAWAVWLEDRITFAKQVKVSQPEAIVVAEQSADRTSWKRSHRIEAPTVDVGMAIFCLVWDRQHNGYLVWHERTPGEDRIQLARFVAKNGEWGAPELVAKSSRRLDYPRCALFSSAPPAGLQSQLGLQVVWLDRDPDNWAKNVIRQRVLDVAKDKWLDPTLLVSGGGDKKILAIVGLQRAGPETWLSFAAEAYSTIFLWVAALEGGALRDEKLVSELSPEVEEVKLGTNRSGAAFFLWKDTHSASTTSLWTVSRGADKAGWSSPHKIVEQLKANNLGESQLSVDSKGNAFVSWREADGSDWKVYYTSYRHTSKRWDDPALFRSIGSGYHTSVIPTAERPMIIAATSHAAYDSVWYSERQAPTGPWDEPAELTRHEGMAVFPSTNAVSMPTGQLAAFWYERKRQTRDVGGVLLGYDNLELWGVMVHPQVD
jgi:hypothetical protein